MTPAVPDAYATAQRLGNLVPVPADGAVAWPAGFDRAGVASAAQACLTRSAVARDYARIYALAAGGSGLE
jgi:hypothetical protein